MSRHRSIRVMVVFGTALVLALPLTVSYLSAQTSAAQTRPDFSGTWTMVTPGHRPWSRPGVTFSAAQTPDAFTVKYLVSQSAGNGLDLVRRRFSLTPATKGGDAWPAPMRVATSTSSAEWRGTSLVVQTKITMSPPERGEQGMSVNRPINEKDVWTIAADGTLTIESTASAWPTTERIAFKKISGDDLVSLPVEPAPAAVSPDRDGTWAGGYQFGMTMKDARAVTACPGRKYNGSNPGVLTCDGVSFAGMPLRLSLHFRRGALSSLELSGEWGSQADARQATDDLLAYLNRAFGPAKSLDLGAEPVTTDAIWRNVDAQPRLGRYSMGLVQVLTPRRYTSAIVTANFSKGAAIVEPQTRHAEDIESNPKTVDIGRPIGFGSYRVSATITKPEDIPQH